MRVVTFRVRGKERTIYAPDPKEKKAFRALIPELDRLLARKRGHRCLHGFVKGRSPVTNALAHVGRRFTVTFDLSNFFDSVTDDHLRAAGVPNPLSHPLRALVLVNGAPRQGLPSSPAAANLAATPMDWELLTWLGAKGDPQATYTRYADDLTISTDRREIAQAALAEVPGIVMKHGFAVNPKKTHLYDARCGRRPITGVAVGPDGIHPTRAMKRKLRAALHQGNEAQARGLAEWCKLKLPKAARKAPPRAEKKSRNNVVCAGGPAAEAVSPVFIPAAQRRRIVFGRERV